MTDECDDVSAQLALSSNLCALPLTGFPVKQVPVWSKSSKPGSHNLMPSHTPSWCSGWQSSVRLCDQALSELLLPACACPLLSRHWVKQMRRPRPEGMRCPYKRAARIQILSFPTGLGRGDCGGHKLHSQSHPPLELGAIGHMSSSTEGTLAGLEGVGVCWEVAQRTC